MGYYLHNIDFTKHNEEVKQVWTAYNAGKPIRVPVGLGINPRIYLLNPELNVEGVTFEQYSENPDLMAQIEMKSQHYVRHNLLQDAEMGLPESWYVYVDLQNVHEPAWFGADVEYRDGQVPATRPILTEDNKRMLFDRGIPDPFKDGIMAKNWQFYEHMKANMDNYSYDGVSAGRVSLSGLGTDGPFTIASNLRGGTEICMELYTDPDYIHELLRYITEATIHRIKSVRKALGQEIKPKSFQFADDSIEMLSVDMYKEFVLPYHKMLVSELGGEGPHSIHLCGNVQRLMPTIVKELNVDTWDAGFPVDYENVRKELGPDVCIHTGPTVALLLDGSPEEVDAECKRILQSGITEGGKFILIEANNLSPCTPVENVAAMYEAACKYGKF
jgi:uroporphyrinogen-III decarboxylase